MKKFDSYTVFWIIGWAGACISAGVQWGFWAAEFVSCCIMILWGIIGSLCKALSHD